MSSNGVRRCSVYFCSSSFFFFLVSIVFGFNSYFKLIMLSIKMARRPSQQPNKLGKSEES